MMRPSEDLTYLFLVFVFFVLHDFSSLEIDYLGDLDLPIDQIRSTKKKEEKPGGQASGWKIEHVCKFLGSCLLKTVWTSDFRTENM